MEADAFLALAVEIVVIGDLPVAAVARLLRRA
jgi:hypothetical protein